MQIVTDGNDDEKQTTTAIDGEQPATPVSVVTTSTTERVIKVKNKVNPRDYMYTGNEGLEHQQARTRVICALSPDDAMQLAMPSVSEELARETQELFNTVKVGDVIGYLASKLIISDVTEDEAGNAVLTTGDELLVASDSDVVLAHKMGLLEILYRDGKPFGIPEEREVKLIIHNKSNNAVTNGEQQPLAES